MMKKKLLENKKKTLVILVCFLFLLISIIGLVLITTNTKDSKESIDTENINETQKEEQNNDKLISDEKNEVNNEQQEEKDEVENHEKEKEETINKEENKTETQKTENNQTVSKPNNSTTNKNDNTTNNNSVTNNSNNTVNSNTNNNSSDKTEIQKQVVEVTSSNINLNNYDSDIIIQKDGTYTLTGTLKYTVYVKGESKVTLNLNGVTIKSKTDAAIANIDTNELVINLKEGTTNTLSDGIVESSYDGCIFSYGAITINGTGSLTINGNQVDGEGIATKNSPITINNGNIKIYTVDDGLNTGGNGGTISINSGNLYVESGGDAIDSNKNIVINGGTTTLIGGTVGINSSLDADDGYEINGGLLLALGTEQYTLPNNTTQNTLLFGFKSFINSKTIITLLNSKGDVITSFKINSKFKNIIISSNNLVNDKYHLYSGGSNTGTLKNGIYEGGIYTKGDLVSINDITEFEIKDKITSYKES